MLPVTSEPPPPADNENQAGHEWPVMDLVLENALLDHEDARTGSGQARCSSRCAARPCGRSRARRTSPAKTHLAVAIGREAITVGYTVLFVAAPTLVASARQGACRGPARGAADPLRQAEAPDRRRARLPAVRARCRASVLPARVAALRARRDADHLQPRRQRVGHASSATPWWRPRSSTGCFTTATSSPSGATATGSAKSAAAAFCRSPLRRRANRISHDERGSSSQTSQRVQFRMSLDKHRLLLRCADNEPALRLPQAHQ